MNEIVQAKAAFLVGRRLVRGGETFSADHPLVRAYPEKFEPFRVENENEVATATPRRAGRTTKPK